MCVGPEDRQTLAGGVRVDEDRRESGAETQEPQRSQVGSERIGGHRSEENRNRGC